MIRKIIAGLVIAVTLFAGVGHAQEWSYCRGLIQGNIDAFSAFLGPLSADQPDGYWDNVLNMCYANPNDPFDIRPQFPLFFGGNAFDATVDLVKSWLP